jgi:hypothetical protein
MPPMESLLRYLTVLSSGMFAGAAFYVAAVEHPARMAAGVSVALQEFRKSYARALPLQIGFAVVSFLGSVVVSWLGHQWSWLIGGVLIGGAVPFTMIYMMPTNRLLLDVRSPLKDDAARALLVKWGQYHIARTFLGVLGFLILLRSLWM